MSENELSDEGIKFINYTGESVKEKKNKKETSDYYYDYNDDDDESDEDEEGLIGKNLLSKSKYTTFLQRVGKETGISMDNLAKIPPISIDVLYVINNYSITIKNHLKKALQKIKLSNLNEKLKLMTSVGAIASGDPEFLRDFFVQNQILKEQMIYSDLIKKLVINVCMRLFDDKKEKTVENFLILSGENLEKLDMSKVKRFIPTLVNLPAKKITRIRDIIRNPIRTATYLHGFLLEYKNGVYISAELYLILRKLFSNYNNYNVIRKCQDRMDNKENHLKCFFSFIKELTTNEFKPMSHSQSIFLFSSLYLMNEKKMDYLDKNKGNLGFNAKKIAKSENEKIIEKILNETNKLSK